MECEVDEGNAVNPRRKGDARGRVTRSCSHSLCDYNTRIQRGSFPLTRQPPNIASPRLARADSSGPGMPMMSGTKRGGPGTFTGHTSIGRKAATSTPTKITFIHRVFAVLRKRT